MNASVRINRRLSAALAWMLTFSMLLATCSSKPPAPTLPTEAPTGQPTQLPPEPTATQPPATQPSTQGEKSPSGLSADPQRVEFQAEDGKKLVGYYYPSKYANAPIVILMHWVGGD